MISQISRRVSFILYVVATGTVAATALRPVAHIEVSDYFFAGSIIAAIVASPREIVSAIVSLPRLTMFGVAALITGTLISLPATPFPYGSLGILARFVFLVVLWFALGLVTLPNYPRIKIAVQAWTVSAGLIGYTAVLEVTLHIHMFGAPNFSYVGRASGLTLHPNDLGAICSLAFVPAASLLLSSRELTSAIWRTGCIVGVLAGILISGSVDGYVVTVLTGVAWLATLRMRRLAAGIAFGSASLATVVFALTSPLFHIRSPLQRIAQVTAHDPTASLGTRLDLASRVIGVMQQHPLIGVGLDPGSEQRFVPSYPENMVLVVWLGAGVLGVLGLGLIAVSIGLRAIRIFRTTELARSLAISYFGFLVYSLASPLLQQRFAWMSAAFILAIAAVSARDANYSPPPGLATKTESGHQAIPT